MRNEFWSAICLNHFESAYVWKMLNMQLRLKYLRLVLKWCLHRVGTVAKRKRCRNIRWWSTLPILCLGPFMTTSQLHNSIAFKIWMQHMSCKISLKPKILQNTARTKQVSSCKPSYISYMRYIYIYIFPKRVRYGLKKATSWLIHPSFWRQGPSFITWCFISRWEDFNCTGR